MQILIEFPELGEKNDSARRLLSEAVRWAYACKDDQSTPACLKHHIEAYISKVPTCYVYPYTFAKDVIRAAVTLQPGFKDCSVDDLEKWLKDVLTFFLRCEMKTCAIAAAKLGSIKEHRPWFENCFSVLEKVDVSRSDRNSIDGFCLDFRKDYLDPVKTKLEELSEKHPIASPFFREAFEKTAAAFEDDEDGMQEFFEKAEAFLQACESTAKAAASSALEKKPTIKRKKKRAAVIYGTFDPFHNGHLNLANRILKQKKADKVVFLPLGYNKVQVWPEINYSKVASSYDDRYHMIAQVIHDNYLTPDITVIHMLDVLQRLPKGAFDAAVKEFGVARLKLAEDIMPCVQQLLGDGWQIVIVSTMHDLVDAAGYLDDDDHYVKAKFNRKLWERYPVIFAPPDKKFNNGDDIVYAFDDRMTARWLDAQIPSVKKKLMENMLDTKQYEKSDTDAISSLMIRRLIGKHCNVAEYVPNEVYQYIIGKRLYF